MEKDAPQSNVRPPGTWVFPRAGRFFVGGNERDTLLIEHLGLVPFDFVAVTKLVSMEPQPRVIIIAGPNGAGKTTFAREFLPQEAECMVFVNADLIAEGIAPFSPTLAAARAGRVMLKELKHHFEARRSFAFETTLAGRGYLRHIDLWRAAGFNVKIVFLQLTSVDEAIRRVAERVRQGGHNIPDAVIRRRFDAGMQNFERLYAPRVDTWTVHDNSGARPIFVRCSDT